MASGITRVRTIVTTTAINGRLRNNSGLLFLLMWRYSHILIMSQAHRKLIQEILSTVCPCLRRCRKLFNQTTHLAQTLSIGMIDAHFLVC